MVVLYILYAALTFESVNEIQWRDHSNEITSAVLWHLFSSNFRVCGQISIPYQKKSLGWLKAASGKKRQPCYQMLRKMVTWSSYGALLTLSLLRFTFTCSWKRTVATANGMHDADIPTSAMAKFTNKRWSWVLIERFQNTTRQTEMLPRIPINVVMPSRIPMIRTMPDSGILSVMLKCSWSAGPPRISSRTERSFQLERSFPLRRTPGIYRAAEAVKLRILLEHFDKSRKSFQACFIKRGFSFKCHTKDVSHPCRISE